MLRHEKRILLIGGGVILIALACVGYSIHHTYNVVMANAYTSEWAAHFVIEHLKSTENEWPTGWNDLLDEFDMAIESGNRPATSWEELKERVVIDWKADPDALVSADGMTDPPFRVIWLSDGSAHHWEGLEPNRRVYDYLRSIREDSEGIDPTRK